MRKKQWLTLPVTLMLSLALLAGCGTGTTPVPTESATTTVAGTAASASATPEAKVENVNEFGWAVPAETLEITAYDAGGTYAPSEEAKQGRANLEKYLLDKFNVKFTMLTTDGDGEENLNLMLASGDYPPVVYNLGYNGVLKLKAQGKTQDLTPYMDTVGKDIKTGMGDTYPLFLDAEKKLHYVPIGCGALMELPDYSAHIRWDEYNAIGKPEIKTPDDYYNALNAILAKFPTTPAGEKRYAMSLYLTNDSVGGPMAGSVGGFWGMQKGWKVNADKSLTHWAFAEEGKAMTKWFNRFSKDGTLDPDSFVNKFDEWKAKFSNERVVGAVGGWWISYNAGHEVWLQTDPNLPEDKRYVQIGFKAPEAAAATVTGKSKFGWANTVLTDKATDVESLLTFINFQATEPGLALFGWGIPNGTPTYKDPNVKLQEWDIQSDGTWAFNEEAKKLFLNETWDYEAEAALGAGLFTLFSHCNRWADGIHCIWGNQMWYSENKWKSLMIDNLKGTLYDFTPLVLREKSEDLILMETALSDAWKQTWPMCVQAADDAAFDSAWKAMQEALTAAGIETYTKAMEDNYKANLSKLGQ